MAPDTKLSTRSSIRHSLNLAGKALADVINKEGRDGDAKKGKDLTSRRLSSINLIQGTAASRTSLGGDTKPLIQKSATPDSKTITRKTRRASAVQPLESLAKHSAVPDSAENFVNTRSSSRRLLPTSALPKYRPRSVVVDSGKKTPPLAVAGTRRRHSSDDEKEATKGESKSHPPSTPQSNEKITRPMSPLPRRLTFNLAAVNIRTSPVPQGKCSSSPRPTKSVKTTTASVLASSIPRPPSSGSSVNSTRTPTTPKTPTLKPESRRSDRSKTSKGNESPTPLRAPPSLNSPLARHSRNHSALTTDINHTTIGNMSHISEGNSEDSEADDVEMLLAPVASLAAPTPAMPRIEMTGHRHRPDPHTPTRSSNRLPARANLSYLSPLPPDGDSPSRRPPRQPGSDKGRGSILSWEELASEASNTLGEDELDSMLADIPAPFHFGASPSPRSSHLEESPCLSATHSPGGYGSISQVLLPDVTPSPAIHHNHNTKFDHMSTRTSAVDASTVTLLRLQLASAENIGKERLHRLQSLEEEIHDLKAARLRDAEGLGEQVSLLEARLRSDRDLKERVDEERSAYIASLEIQLKQAQAEAAITHRASEDAALRSRGQKLEVACAARGAGAQWASVRDIAESELDLIRANREMLSILLAGLDQSQRQLCLVTA